MAIKKSIPFDGSYAKIPINRAASAPRVGPPDGSGKPGRMAEAIATVVFGANYNDGSINQAFPLANRVAAQEFVIPIAIVSVTLSTSIVNATTDGVIAVWVGRDIGASGSIMGSNDVYVVHTVNQGLSHSMNSGVAYDEQIAPYFGSGQRLAVYISSAGTGFANNRVIAVATIRYFPLT